MARGEKFTRETPCKRCSGVEFYVSSRLCVQCSQATARAQYVAKQTFTGTPPEVLRAKRREDQARALRLATVRAEKTARQRACAYGVPI